MSDSISRWWYFIPVYPVCLFLLLFHVGDAGGGANRIWVSSLGPLFAVAGAVVLLGNLPLAICLLMDARAVKSGDFEWKPNPYAYGILGLSGYLATSYIGLSSTKVEVFGFTLDWGIQIRQFAIFVPVVACLFYLFQRYRYVGFR